MEGNVYISVFMKINHSMSPHILEVQVRDVRQRGGWFLHTLYFSCTQSE